jgi:hypothetical protein
MDLKNHCHNCDHPMPENSRFCSACGQKAFDGRIRLKELLGNMMINIIHLDTKFIRVFWRLFIPGKVSTDYFEGKIIRYPNPVQFFFIIAFFFVLTASKQCNRKLELGINLNQKSQTDSTALVQNDPAADLAPDETLPDNPEKFGVNFNEDTAEVYTGLTLFKAAEKYVEYVKIRRRYDRLPDSMKSAATDHVVDKLLSHRKNDVFNSDSITISLFGNTLEVSILDLVEMDLDQLTQYYGVRTWYDRLLFKQGIKTMRDIRSVNNAFIGSITWTILAFIVVMAAFFWLFLRRRRPYYVEHFIFLMHYLSAVLLVFAVIMAVDFWLGDCPQWVVGVSSLWSMVFMYLAMRRFYNTSYGATFLYWAVLSVIALALFLILGVIGPIVSLLVF